MRQYGVILTCFVIFIQINNSFQNRIIGGSDARTGQFPYSAAIYATSQDGRYFCGGTLISNQWVLTAGQCVDKMLQFTIQIGSNLLSGNDSNRISVSTSHYVLHPDYNAATFANDVGLIELRQPIEFTSYIKKVDMLPNGNLYDGSRLTAIGWGNVKDDSSSLSNDLQFVQLIVISIEECQAVFGPVINENTVCVDGNYNEGTCFGDTGSGLFEDIGRGFMMIVGVSSFINGNGCESTDPSGYTRIFSYTPWIKNVTNIV